jgi:hypothetical protein
LGIDRRLPIKSASQPTIAAEGRQDVAEKGHSFSKRRESRSVSRAVAYALKCELGATHQAVKIIRRWTGAGERTVKNWLAGVSGPSGQHLVDLIRHSDDVLAVMLILAGRQQVVVAQRLLDVRNKLAEMVEQVDKLLEEVNRNGGG